MNIEQTRQVFLANIRNKFIALACEKTRDEVLLSQINNFQRNPSLYPELADALTERASEWLGECIKSKRESICRAAACFIIDQLELPARFVSTSVLIAAYKELVDSPDNSVFTNEYRELVDVFMDDICQGVTFTDEYKGRLRMAAFRLISCVKSKSKAQQER